MERERFRHPCPELGTHPSLGSVLKLSGLSDHGRNVAELLNTWARGLYHLDTSRADWRDSSHLELVHYGELSTVDDEGLTSLVVLAHQHGVRISIRGAGPRYLRLGFSRRTPESADVMEGHPGLAHLVARVQRVQSLNVAEAPRG